MLARARQHGLHVRDQAIAPGARGLLAALADVRDLDVLNLTTYLDPEARRLLFRSASTVLANSSHEPFGLVGLEAMAAGGIACTGSSPSTMSKPPSPIVHRLTTRSR